MRLKSIIAIVVATCIYGFSVAQVPEQTSDLSAEDLAELTERATQKVNQFNNHLSLIAKPARTASAEEKKNIDAYKSRLIKQCLSLFIGKGYDYEDMYGNKKEAVKMEVSSYNKRTKKVAVVKRPTVRQYLHNMRRNRQNYDSISITASDCYVQPNSVREVEDGLYECTLSYTQWYRGESELRTYSDKTDKVIKVYFERTEIDGKTRWLIWLGDVSVAHTEGV